MIRKKVKHFLNALARRTPWHNNTLFEDCVKFWRHNTFNLQVINLGSTSAVYAFDYSEIPVKAANFALSRNPLAGDLSILKNYVSYLDSNCSYVIIPLCPFSSLAGSYNYMDDRYYTILYPSSIINYSYIRELQVLHKRDNPFMYYPISALFTDLIAMLRRRESILSEKALSIDAYTKIKGWFNEFSIDGFEKDLSLINKDAINDAAEMLNSIVSYCLEKKIIPIITVPPVHQTLYRYLKGKGEDLLIDSLLLKLDNKDIVVKNYLSHPEFCNNRSLFKNSFLLNKDGAKKYTKLLLQDLNIL